MTKMQAAITALGLLITAQNVSASLDIEASGCNNHNCPTSRHDYTPAYDKPPAGGKWIDTVTPKRNWQCNKVEDIQQPMMTCQMCERQQIRYVHQMTHAFHAPLQVGCICAAHMDGSFDTLQQAKAHTKQRERGLRNRATRRAKWCALKGWKRSRNGNPYIKKQGHNITMIKGKYGGYSSIFSQQNQRNRLNKYFPTINQAKLAVFDKIWPTQVRIPA